jgi:mRNA interferase MazF
MIGPPYQWRVVQADLNPVRGSEQAGTRPVLIVSDESLNTVLPVVAGLPLTTPRPGRRAYRHEVFLPAGSAGQPNDSIAMAQQIRTLAKERLGRTYGFLEDEGLRARIRAAMKIFLDLE